MIPDAIKADRDATRPERNQQPAPMICTGTIRSGAPCQRVAVNGTDRCDFHQRQAAQIPRAREQPLRDTASAPAAPEPSRNAHTVPPWVALLPIDTAATASQAVLMLQGACNQLVLGGIDAKGLDALRLALVAAGLGQPEPEPE